MRTPDTPCARLAAFSSSISRTTGTSITQHRTQSRKQRPFRIVKVALELPREILYKRINQRVDAMMEQGLESEVRALLPCRQLKNLQTVGYAELFDYFDGNCTLPEAIEKIKQKKEVELEKEQNDRRPQRIAGLIFCKKPKTVYKPIDFSPYLC